MDVIKENLNELKVEKGFLLFNYEVVCIHITRTIL